MSWHSIARRGDVAAFDRGPRSTQHVKEDSTFVWSTSVAIRREPSNFEFRGRPRLSTSVTEKKCGDELDTFLQPESNSCFGLRCGSSAAYLSAPPAAGERILAANALVAKADLLG